jgi:hypothetical protein
VQANIKNSSTSKKIKNRSKYLTPSKKSPFENQNKVQKEEKPSQDKIKKPQPVTPVGQKTPHESPGGPMNASNWYNNFYDSRGFLNTDPSHTGFYPLPITASAGGNNFNSINLAQQCSALKRTIPWNN